MHPVLPHQRWQNRSETIIKAVKICVRKGPVVSCPHYHTRWEWSLFAPLFPGISITVRINPLGKQWNMSILQSSREVHRAEQRPRSPSRHSCYKSVKGRHCRAVTRGEKAEELHQPQQKSQHRGPDVTKGVPTDAPSNLCQQQDSLYSPSTCHLQQD